MFGRPKKDQSPKMVELKSDRSSSQSESKDGSVSDVEHVQHVDVVVLRPSSKTRSVSIPSPEPSSSMDDHRQSGSTGQSCGRQSANGADDLDQEPNDWRSLFKSKKSSSGPPEDKKEKEDSRLHQIIRILAAVWAVVRFCYNCCQMQQKKKKDKKTHSSHTCEKKE